MKYTYKFKVRFSDTDAYGIIHHSYYYHYFEEARFQFSVEELGFMANQAADIKFPLIESTCSYRNPLYFTTAYYLMELEADIIENAKLVFYYTILSEDRTKKYASGKTVHVHVKNDNRLSLHLPEWLKTKIEQKKQEGMNG